MSEREREREHGGGGGWWNLMGINSAKGIYTLNKACVRNALILRPRPPLPSKGTLYLIYVSPLSFKMLSRNTQ